MSSAEIDGFNADRPFTDLELVNISRHLLDWPTKATILGLPEGEIENIKVDEKDSNEQQKIKMMRRWRERNGDRASLRTLIQVSRGHETMVSFIQNVCEEFGYREEEEEVDRNGTRFVEGGGDGQSTEVAGAGGCNREPSFAWRLLKKILIASFVFLVVLSIIWVITMILFATTIPNLLTENDQLIFEEGILPLASNIRKEWLESVDIRVTSEMCRWNVSVINGANCTSLPVKRYKSIPSDYPCFVLSLRGSFFNITVPSISSLEAEAPNIWFSHNIEAFNELDDQLSNNRSFLRCTDNRSNSKYTCSPAKQYQGTSYVFNITTPGYYCYSLTTSHDNQILADNRYGIEISYTAVTYNYTAIRERYNPDISTARPGQTSLAIRLSSSFNYGRESCVLLGFTCDDEVTGYPSFSINNLKRRSDTLYLLLILYVVSVIIGVMILSVIIFFLQLKKNYRFRELVMCITMC